LDHIENPRRYFVLAMQFSSCQKAQPTTCHQGWVLLHN
jgi:hypothetical protein